MSRTSVEEDQTDKAARQAGGEFVRGVSAYRTTIEADDVEAGRALDLVLRSYW